MSEPYTPKVALPGFTASEVAKHKEPTDLWIIVSGKVYDVSAFQHKHPGGAKVLGKVGGKDATAQFKKFHREIILKRPHYEALCVGTVKIDEKGEGRFWGLFQRKKTEVATA